MTTPVVVVGGGIGGAAAALELARAGREVVLLERGGALGGLVVSFEVAGTPLECFYHHIFPHETHIQRLIDELGLTPRLEWHRSTVGVLTDGRIWPFTSPADLLRFGPLPPLDRLRTGIGALRLARVRDWEALDTVPARDWLAAYTGRRAADVVWDPLLAAKFGPAAPTVPAAWMWARFQQRAGARKRGGERLGYLRGGFRQLFEALDRELRRLGVDVRTGARVERIVVEDDRVTGVQLADGIVDASTVLYSGALPGLEPLLPAGAADPGWSAIGGLGVQCVVLELERPVTDLYWTNVCDPELPFGGLIEHTNMLPPADYGGRHVVYLSRYFTADEAIASTPPEEEADAWLEALERRLPSFHAGDVLARHVFRTPYGAPLVALGHRGRVPDAAGPVGGLYLSTTAQIYPEDRGMSDGVRTGVGVARRVLHDGAEDRSGGRTGHPATARRLAPT